MHVTPKKLIVGLSATVILLLGIIVGLLLPNLTRSNKSDQANFLGSGEETRAKQFANEIANARVLRTTYIGLSPKMPDTIVVNVVDNSDPDPRTHNNWILVYRPTHSDYSKVQSLKASGQIAQGTNFPALRFVNAAQDTLDGDAAYIDFLKLVDR